MPLPRAVLAFCLMLPAFPAAAIVGGTEAPPQSAVMVLNSAGGVCSAVVLAPDAVLTAGHCAAGPHALRCITAARTDRPVLVEVAARAIHPGYDAGAVAKRRRSVDLALLRPSEPPPARFAPADLGAGEARTGETLTLSGYGASKPGDPRSTGTFRSVAIPVVEPYGPSKLLVWMQGARGPGPARGIPAARGGCGRRGPRDHGLDRRSCGGLTQAVRVAPHRDWIDRTLSTWNVSAHWQP